jgi:peptide-methionine (S)-S-oxide reductase
MKKFGLSHDGLLLIAAVLAFGLWATMGSHATTEATVLLPPPVYDPAPQQGKQTVVFAGGCFWGVQAVFQHTQGVEAAVSGYAGGEASTANYSDVSSGGSGHAEAVQVTYDPQKVSYGRLLQIYFGIAHDPTQLDRQGPDVGSQYRSAIFYTDPMQHEVTMRYIAQLEAAKAFGRQIVTQLVPLGVSGSNTGFYPAESYHQDYATLYPQQPYIAQFDRPKIASLRKLLPEVWRETPVLVGPQL